MKRIYLLILMILAAGCSKEASETSARLDKMDGKLDAIGQAIESCNADIVALQALVKGGTVTSCTQSGKNWNLQFSDGSSITLKAGNAGSAPSPLMSVDADGFWMMDLGDGSVYVRDSAGEKVCAAGMATATPLLSVDAEGYWTVSFDGGVTYARVKDPGGAGVKATAQSGAQSSIFADVQDNGTSVTVTLRNGESFTLPVEKGFSCILDADPATVYSFSAGQTRGFPVTMSGVASTFTQAPQGWTASVAGSVLNVTAPSSLTGTSAGGTVSLVAISANGFTSVSYLKVTRP